MAMGSYQDVVTSIDTPFTKTMREFVNARDTEASDDVEISTEEKGKAVSDNSDNLQLGSSPQDTSATGSVPWGIYYKFFTSGANGFVLFVLFMGMVVGQGAAVVTDWWLSRWSTQSPEAQQTQGVENAYIYGILTSSVFIISMLRALLFFMLCIKATRKVFVNMLQAVLRSPMHFFQTTPVGRSMKFFL